MSKVTVDQLRKTLKALTKNLTFSKCNTFDCIVEKLLTECESFRAPFYIHDVSVHEERAMLYNHKQYTEKSNLCELLASRFKEVLLIVDDVLPAKEAIHFITMTDDSAVIREWLTMLRKYNILVRQVDYKGEDSTDNYILLAPVTSFLNQNGE